MSLELARAYVQIVPSMQGVQSAINQEFGRAGDSAGRLTGERARGGILKGVAAAGAGIIGAIGIAKVGGAIGRGVGETVSRGLTRAIDIQNAQKKLSGLGHSADDVAKIMGNALASVRGTAFGLGDAATVAASAVAAGIKPGKELTGYLKLTADTATIAGTSLSDMGAILNKATASGTVYSDTLNQLSDRGVPVFQYLQKEYHTTADGLTAMVRKGQVDAVTLDKVLAEHLGGAALKSGETAAGAYANVGAAFGRLGVQLGAGKAVEKAPALFTAIASAVDSGSTAITPLSDILNHQLGLGFRALTGYINGIDFARVGGQVKVIAGNVKAFLGGLQKPSSSPVGIPVNGFAAAGAKVRGILGSTIGVVHGFVDGVRTAFSSLTSGKGLNLSGFGTVGKTFTDIRTVVTPLFPLLLEVGKAVGSVAGSFGQLIAAGVPLLPPILNVLAGIVGFLADHIDQLLPLLPVIAVGFIAWRTATTSVAAANRVLTAAQLAALPITVANTTARLAAANAELRLAAAQGLVVPSLLGAVAATVSQTAATVANGAAWVAARAAQLAGAVATGVMTAAQTALNLALDANPIGIVVIAIAALVAGLVYWITQTKSGQAFFAGFLGFLRGTWAAVMHGITAAISAVAPIVRAVLGAIVGYFTAQLTAAKQVVSTVLAGVAAVFRTYTAIWSAVVRAAFGTIHAVVTAGVNVVKTVLGAALAVVVAIFTGRWNQIPGIVTGAVSRVAGIVRGLSATVVGILKKLGGDIVGAFGNAGRLLLQVGGQIVDGLISGIRGGIAGAVSAISGLINLLPAAARHLLGIHSPSRVFAQIGRYVAQGLTGGLAGSQDQVKSASEKLVNGVTDAFSKLVSNREAAQKRLAKLNTQLARTSTKTQSGRNRASDLRGQIGEQKAALDAAKRPGGTKGFVAALKADTDQLTVLAGRRDRLADQLKTAQDDLTSAVKVRDDFRDQVQQTTIGLGDVVAAFSSVVDARAKARDAIADTTSKIADLASNRTAANKDVASTRGDLADNAAKIAKLQASARDATATIARLSKYGDDYASTITDLRDKLAGYTGDIAAAQSDRGDLTSKLQDQLAKVSDYTKQIGAQQAEQAKAQTAAVQAATPTILSTLRDAVANTKAFQATLGKLRGQGIDDATYSELLQKGVADGGLQAAQELAAAGPGVVKQVSALQGQLSAAGKALGTSASTVLYQAGVDTAQASVDGIKAKIVDNQAAIGLLELAIAGRVKKLGFNTSVLSKNAGKQFTAGLADGISGSGSDLDKVIDRLGQRAVNRLKKKLDIHSPSRVARTEIGQQFGLGMALGIEDMYGAAEQASAGLAAIPSTAFAGGLGSLGMPEQLAPIQQNFNGPMGYSADELAATAAARARRALNGVNIPKVSVQ